MMHCKDCKHRNSDGLCLSDKVDEYYHQSEEEKKDMLVYSYDESGTFYVGPEFGCVHFEAKT